MALKSSKTGSLPVSEIYGFMTENFPYFKVAQLMFLHCLLNYYYYTLLTRAYILLHLPRVKLVKFDSFDKFN